MTKEQLEEFETALQRYIFENVDLDEFFENEFRKLKGNWSLRTYYYQKIKIGINVKYYGYENYEKIKELFPTMTDDTYYELIGYEIQDFFDFWEERFKNEFGVNLLCFGRGVVILDSKLTIYQILNMF